MNNHIISARSILWAIIVLLNSSQLIHGLSNSDIINLHKAGIGADTLVVAINNADEKDFNLSALSLIELKEAGVDETVIQAMLTSTGSSPAEEPVNEVNLPPVVEENVTSATVIKDVPEVIVPPKSIVTEPVPEENEEPAEPQPVYNPPKIKTPPTPISRSAPIYPEQLRDEGVSGSVVVRFTVNTNGDVQDIVVIESDHELFTKSALQALNEWKFNPALEDGEPVNTIVKLPIPFSLKGKSSATNRAPQIIARPSPSYPSQLRKQGITGSVKVRFVVNTSGDVEDIEVLTSDHELFTKEAVKVLGKWKFLPALDDGQPIDARVQISIPFKIINDEME